MSQAGNAHAPVPSEPYPLASTGLAAAGQRFGRALTDTSRAVGLPTRVIAHDYWLVRALHGIHAAVPAGGEIVFPPLKSHLPERRVGTWAFGGGTSLTAAWGVCGRYSEDIDGLLFLDNADLSKHVIEKACGQIARAACENCEAVRHETHGRMVKRTTIDVAGHLAYLKLETVVLRGTAPEVDSVTVRSLIARHSDDELEQEFPELGGFAVPCVRPAYTAINKLDALHRRAASGDLHGLAARGRDLYDLWEIAQRPEHADEVRASVEAVWESVAGQIRDSVERPAGGYARSAAFRIGSDESTALRTGYENAVDAAVWGESPKFEDAVAAAVSLDDA